MAHEVLQLDAVQVASGERPRPGTSVGRSSSSSSSSVTCAAPRRPLPCRSAHSRLVRCRARAGAGVSVGCGVAREVGPGTGPGGRRWAAPCGVVVERVGVLLLSSLRGGCEGGASQGRWLSNAQVLQ